MFDSFQQLENRHLHAIKYEKTQAGLIHLDHAAHVLTNAFQSDPLWVYFFPDKSERFHKLFEILRMVVRFGAFFGKVYATSMDLEGVAIWLPSDKANMPIWQLLRSGGLSIIPKMSWAEMITSMRYSRFASSIHTHLANFPHWYLQFIGIHPEFQGKGYASRLIKPVLSVFDEGNTSCYLETQKPGNTRIYQHYGFRIVKEKIIPNTHIHHWAMLRPKDKL